MPDIGDGGASYTTADTSARSIRELDLSTHPPSDKLLETGGDQCRSASGDRRDYCPRLRRLDHDRIDSLDVRILVSSGHWHNLAADDASEGSGRCTRDQGPDPATHPDAMAGGRSVRGGSGRFKHRLGLT